MLKKNYWSCDDGNNKSEQLIYSQNYFINYTIRLHINNLNCVKKKKKKLFCFISIISIYMGSKHLQKQLTILFFVWFSLPECWMFWCIYIQLNFDSQGEM